MLRTRITDQYGLKVPFINAGMAFIATAPLAWAVCKAGGMGMLGIAAMPPDVLQAALRDIKAADPACFGVNFIAWFSGIEHIEVCVTEKVPVVSFFWDDPPDEWLSRLRAAGSHIWFQVGSVDEAHAAIRRGAEGLVVQGSEAGGHNRQHNRRDDERRRSGDQEAAQIDGSRLVNRMDCRVDRTRGCVNALRESADGRRRPEYEEDRPLDR
jgi:NAD(P)H-dependent flavin oxidoreductase YrpB (nitropropane dioxygenase family)